MANHDEITPTRALAPYAPFEDGSAGMAAVHDDLVTVACHIVDGGFPNLESCRVFIEDQWHVELELSEIRAARDRLRLAGHLNREGAQLALMPVMHADLDARRTRWESAEALALEDWEVALRSEFTWLTTEDVQILIRDLRPWLDRVISQHGADGGFLLYPQNPRAAALVESLANLDLNFLPACRPELAGVRTAAFRLFVREPSLSQREFLGRLLNTGFYATVLSLDPRAQELARQEASGTVLYFDTNFLYGLLGVGGASEAFAAKRLVELCRELGMSLRVSPWTVDELRTSIAKSRHDVGKVQNTRRAAAVMAQLSGEKGFAPAYWRELRDQGTDADSFFGKFDHFSRFLEAYGIEEHPEGYQEIEEEAAAVRDYTSPLEGMYGPGARPRVVLEHKAKMRLLVEWLRSQTRPAGYSEVRYWFVTESTSLPTYARLPVDDVVRPQYPFCVLSSTWAQIVRAMVPRTADLDQVLVGLLASPYVGYKSAATGDQQVALERVAARMDSLEDVPPSVAIAVVTDRAMASKIGQEVDEAAVRRLVQDAISTKAAELEAQIQETARRATLAEREMAAATERARVAEEQTAIAAAELETTRREEANRATQRSAELVEIRGQLQALQEIVPSLRSDVSSANARADAEHAGREKAAAGATRLRNILAASSAALIAGGSATLLATQTVHGAAGVVALVVVATLAGYTAVRVLSQDLAKEFVIILTVVVAAVTIATAFISRGSSGSPSATPKQGSGRK
jgi:hypothetical protein